MPKNKIEYTVFISSPSDVAEERKIVAEAIKTINGLRAHRSSVFLKTLTWKEDVVPKIGQHPQELINSATEGQYDIFLGIMCAHFGTPTDRAGSGTEEEFQIAYETKANSLNSIEVLFYFKDPRASEHEIDAEQLIKVAEFKRKFQSDYKGMYGSFKTPEEFKSEITLALNTVLDDFEAKNTKSDQSALPLNETEKSPESEGVVNPLDELLAIDEGSNEDGFIELSEHLVESSDLVIECLKPFTALILKLTSNVQKRSHELTDLAATRKPNGKLSKSILEKTADNMDHFVNNSRALLPSIKDSLDDYIDSFRRFIVIVGEDNIGNETEKNLLVDSVNGMLSGLESSYESLDRMSNSISSLPRLTSRINKSKKRAAAIANGTSQMLKSVHRQLKVVSHHLPT